MKILDHKQVRYCNLVKRQQETVEYLPGLIFNNKLFIKDKSFPIKEKKEAQDYGKMQFLENKGEKEYLLLEDITGFTIWTENKQVEVWQHQAKNDASIIKDVEKIVKKMRGPQGLEIKDRRYRLKLYNSCFVGSEFVNWLIENLSISSEQSIKIGQILIDKKIIHHVHDKHDFENDYLFYRFYIDE
ncbi:MAG: pleckstrin/ G-protein interacting- domain protein [Crocosphaera sp.]|nr:pleckstrin/ G-protein interacting- domain protein [Crocosphaera sp.]